MLNEGVRELWSNGIAHSIQKLGDSKVCGRRRYERDFSVRV